MVGREAPGPGRGLKPTSDHVFLCFHCITLTYCVMCETIKSIGMFYISVFLIVKVWEIHSSHEPIKLGQVGIGHSQKSMVEIGPRTRF